jgi:hypothetical protein
MSNVSKARFLLVTRKVFELEMLGQLGAFGGKRHRTNKEIN